MCNHSPNGRLNTLVEDRTTIEKHVRIILRALEGKTYEKSSPVFFTAIKWIQDFPTFIDQTLKERLKAAACITFNLSEAELLGSIEGVVLPRIIPPSSSEDKLRSLLPKGGWFEWYDEYTRYNEAPLSYHIFSSLCILGASLGRRVYLDMGHFKIWPNYCAILIGPTGRVKKTTAADIARDFIHRHSLCPIMADEPTPQALVSALKASGHHFFYAPEMSVFFGKEQFKQGLVPKILRMLDSPAVFEVDTITRGKETVTDLAITLLGCTTPSLLTTSMPTEVTSSGFMNRFVLVVERDTPRIFPRPWKGLGEGKLDETVKRLKAYSGIMDFAPGVEQGWWTDWYNARKKMIRLMADDIMVEILERVPGHLLRTAILIHLVQCDNFLICEKCLSDAAAIIEHVERSTPSMIQSLKQTAVANDADFVLATLTKLGGAADHSTLLRRCAPKMNAQAFKQHIRTLEEQGLLKTSKKGMGQFYVLTGEEAK